VIRHIFVPHVAGEALGKGDPISLEAPQLDERFNQGDVFLPGMLLLRYFDMILVSD
jgi:hypothetical protein